MFKVKNESSDAREMHPKHLVAVTIARQHLLVTSSVPLS